ncbi:hypothetical protein FQN57_003982 [Myotisia sp. PD_48]|nr:hypothetical protein FQN57_003982 [Myotisia sp. PD_48]
MRKIRPFLLLSLLGSPIPALAKTSENSARCLVSISEALSYLSFQDIISDDNHTRPAGLSLESSCTNQLRIHSLYAAAKSYCSPAELEAGEEFLRADCAGAGFELVPYKDVEPELTDDYISKLRVVEFNGFQRGVLLDAPVLISQQYFWRSYMTNKTWAFEIWARHAAGYASYFFWGVVLLTGIIIRVTTHLPKTKSRVHKQHEDPERYSKSPLSPRQFATSISKVNCWIKLHLTIPRARFPYNRLLIYSSPIPTRLEVVVSVSYYIFSLVLISVKYTLFKGNLFFDDPMHQFWRYFSDRTGVMSYSNLILIWFFAGRNNIFLWATGWSFSTFNLFHRTVAAVATAEAVLHSIGYTVLCVQNGRYFRLWPLSWWIMSLAATTLMSLLFWLSAGWLRRRSYEIFLLIHIAASLVILIALFIHTSIFNGEYDGYLWPVVGVWCLDKLARLARLVLCNIHLSRNRNQIRVANSSTYYDTVSDLIRLEVKMESMYPLPRPGEFYYVYQPLKWRGYESHPFTLASWSVIQEEDSKGVDKELIKLKFWIRPFSGWTHRLRSDCLKSPNRIIHTPLLIEGPYGAVTKFHEYEDVTLVVGGTGVAAALPVIMEHMRRTTFASLNRRFDETQGRRMSTSSASSSTLVPSPLPGLEGDMAPPSNTRIQTIRLVWVVRQAEFIREVLDGELRPALDREDIQFHFYCTTAVVEEYEVDSPLPQNDEATALLSSCDDSRPLGIPKPTIAIQSGRPPIAEIISQVFSKQKDNISPVSSSTKAAVLVCGPDGLANETRMAVQEALKAGYTRLDYFEESFGW